MVTPQDEALYEQYPWLRPGLRPGDLDRDPRAGLPAEEYDRMDARMEVIAERLAREDAERRAVWEGELGI
jgi:hypothetical protein